MNLATIEPDTTVIILRNDLTMIYTTWSGTSWVLLRLDIELGVCDTGRDSYPSFIECAAAYRTGAVIWENNHA